MTILESLKLAAEYLEKKNIESSRLNAELMLANILDCSRTELYIHFDKPLRIEEQNKFKSFLIRRSTNEPLQYILGETEFFGLKFRVNRNVLIPRPETEILVQAVIENYHNESFEILDIGTGSGNIGISIAKYLPKAHITCIDISEEALLIAEDNAKYNQVSNIEFMKMDILKQYPQNKKYGIIISNPPYVSIEEKQNLQKEVKEYEPLIALFVDDELKYYMRIVEISKIIMASGGKLYFEVGMNQSEKIKQILSTNNFKNILIQNDLAGIERVICGEN